MEQQVSRLRFELAKMNRKQEVMSMQREARASTLEDRIVDQDEERVVEEIKDREDHVKSFDGLLDKQNMEIARLRLEIERVGQVSRLEERRGGVPRPSGNVSVLPGLIEQSRALSKELAGKESQVTALESTSAEKLAVLDKLRVQAFSQNANPPPPNDPEHQDLYYPFTACKPDEELPLCRRGRPKRVSGRL